jgi:hypothetical protein
VLRLLFAFIDIMLHRRGPDSMPSSSFLLWLLLALSLGVHAALNLWAGGDSRVVAVDVLILGLDVWFVWALLRLFNKQPRFRQTMTALLGADIVLSVLYAPVLPRLAEQDPENPELTLPVLLTVAAFAWAIDINSFVFSRALERPYLLCMAIVIGYALLIRSLQITLLQPLA